MLWMGFFPYHVFSLTWLPVMVPHSPHTFHALLFTHSLSAVIGTANGRGGRRVCAARASGNGRRAAAGAHTALLRSQSQVAQFHLRLTAARLLVTGPSSGSAHPAAHFCATCLAHRDAAHCPPSIGGHPVSLRSDPVHHIPAALLNRTRPAPLAHACAASSCSPFGIISFIAFNTSYFIIIIQKAVSAAAAEATAPEVMLIFATPLDQHRPTSFATFY